MKFAYFALIVAASAVRLAKDPSDQPAKAPAIVKEEPKEAATKETMDERIAKSLEPRIAANKEAQQKAWNGEDKFAAEDRKHQAGVAKGVAADVKGIADDITACKDSLKAARATDNNGEGSTTTPSNSYCPN